MPEQAPSDQLHLQQTIEELRHAERVQKALYQISDLAGTDLETDEILKRLHQIVAKLMYAENFYIFLYNAQKDTVRFRYFADAATRPQDVSAHVGRQSGDDAQPDADSADEHGFKLADIPLGNIENSLTWWVIRLGRPLRGALDDIEQNLPGSLRRLGATSRDWLGVPMLDGNEVKGLLVAQSYEQSNVYSAQDQDLLSFVASHVLTTLQRRQTRKDLENVVISRTQELARANQALKAEVAQRRRNERLQKALYHIAEQASEGGAEKDFFELVHREVGDLFYAENFFVALLVNHDTALEFVYYADQYREAQSKRPLAFGLTEYALRSSDGVLLTRDDIEQLVHDSEVSVEGPNAWAWIGVPLQCEGRTLGLIAVQSYREDRVYQQEDLDLLRFVSRQIANSLERKRALASLKEAKETLEQRVAERTQALSEANAALAEQSQTDPLTGLRNRRHLIEHLPTDIALIDRQHRDARQNPAKGVDKPASLLFLMLDIDHFKQVNDVHGHAVGDRVLMQMSGIINQCMRETDTAVRWGGEEFLLVARFTDPDFAPELAERLRKMISERPFDIGQGRKIRLTCSIGFAQYPFVPERPDRVHWEEAINIADHCLYAAKQSWRDGWVGVAWNEQQTGDGLPARIAPAIPALVESGHLQLHSSRPHSTGLVWQ